ncbi:D-amino-acid oxidase-like [Uranotaenia lowii]|uniref:D-amino-acid oxidase-like n=1 Tax=Uranotaenia lowii TaxID=190385 RepID=UPI00247AC79D|nr:D-amino-acid oxidase-like [Uranotaenia lowii]
MDQNFVILGAGINGLACAYRIARLFSGTSIQIIAERFSPDTTSDVAAGLWEPYLLGDTPRESVRKWSRETYEFFHGLWKSGQAEECGLCLIPYVALSEEDSLDNSFWSDFVFGYRDISEDRLQQQGKEHGKNYRSGAEFVTFTCEPTKLMRYFTKALIKHGAKFHKRRVEDCISEDLVAGSKHSIVINCLGLGASQLVQDPKLIPCRGQIRRVRAPGMFHVLINDTKYIIPNTDRVTLGGTQQMGDSDSRVRQTDTDLIGGGCCELNPTLSRASVLGDLVGFRPVRDAVRLELEWMNLGNQKAAVIHNYGHGGSGITLCWGCAGDVLNLITQLNQPKDDEVQKQGLMTLSKL